MDAPQLRKAILPFIAGFVFCGAIVLLLTHGAGSKLNADLAAAGWSLDTAIRLDRQRDAIERGLRIDLKKSNGLIEAQQSIIGAQQSQLGEQQSIIDGIFTTIDKGGSGLRGSIKTIKDRANSVYRFYYPSED
jgi:hypothetical protein